MARERTHSRQWLAVSSRKWVPTSATVPWTVSSGPSSSVTACSKKKAFSSTTAVTGASVVSRTTTSGPTYRMWFEPQVVAGRSRP